METLFFRACAALAGLFCVEADAQTIHDALDAPAGVVIDGGGWSWAADNRAHDGIDFAHAGSIHATCVPWAGGVPLCSGTHTMTIRLTGPARVSVWAMNETGVYFLGLDAPGFSKADPANGTLTNAWSQFHYEFGPGPRTLVARATSYSSIEGLLEASGMRLDELQTQALSPVTVEEALDLPGEWTTSGAWQGGENSTLAASGGDYAWLSPPASGGEAGWVERTVTGPVQVNWKWHSESTSGTFQCLLDGAVVRTGGATGWSTGWENDSLTVPAGTHTVRWQAVAPANPALLAAALDGVSITPPLYFDTALGTAGLTWTTGGEVPWVTMDESGVPEHPTLVAFHGAAGQSGWLQTPLTGPGYLDFWASGGASFTVSLNGNGIAPHPDQNRMHRLSIPPGFQMLRFTSTGQQARVDSVVMTSTENFPGAVLDSPGTVFLESYTTTPTPVVSGDYTGGFALSGGNSGNVLFVSFGEGALPLVATVRHKGASSLYLSRDDNTGGYLTLPGSGGLTNTSGLWLPASRGRLDFPSSGSFTIDSITAVQTATVSVAAALDTTQTVWVSHAGVATGVAGEGYGDGDALWLQGTATGDPAYATVYVIGPAYVTAKVLGSGTVTGNGRTDSVNDPGSWRTLSWDVQAGVTTQISWLSSGGTSIAARNGLLVDALVVERLTSVRLSDALEAGEWTSSGGGTWQGGTYTPWENGRGDFAQAPALSPGQETWIESTLTGPFDLDYQMPAAGNCLRLEIDGVVQADTAVHPGNGTWRVHTGAASTRRCRLIVSRDAAATGLSEVPLLIHSASANPGGSLAGLSSALSVPEAVFWVDGGQVASNWPSTIEFRALYGSNFFLTGRCGLYLRGPGRCEFLAVISPGMPPNPIWMAAPVVSCSLTLNGLTEALAHTWNPQSRTVGSGLHCAVWTASVQSIYDPLYHYVNHSIINLLELKWLPGNSAYQTWAGPLLTGFASQPDSDPDGDGVTNDLEFLTGTQPHNSASLPQITAARIAGNLRVTVPLPPYSMSGSSLLPQTSPDLQSWTDAPSALLSTANGLRTYEVPVAGEKSFMRFRAVITP